MRRTIDLARAGQKITGPAGVRIRVALALCIVLGLGTVGTLALWSNSATATSGQFTTGVVDLRVNGVKTYVFGTTPSFTMTNMIPGESRAATLTVQNTLSTLPLTYTISASTPTGSPALANHLQLRVFAGSTSTNGSSGGLNTGTCNGTQLGSATLRSAASVPLVTTAQALGAGTGTTTPPSTQDLCLVVTLLANAPVTIQNQSVSFIALTFAATTT